MPKKSFLQYLNIPHHEYWPWYLILVPMWPVWIWYGIRLRCLTYFTTVNPSFEDGDFMATSKDSILELIPSKYKPLGIIVELPLSTEAIQQKMHAINIAYPCIAKPDIGGMGRKVEVINNLQELDEYAKTVNENFIIQEKIDYPLEFGVLYYHIPNTQIYGITSVVQKEFLHVIGNGTNNILQLMQQNYRASTQILRLQKLQTINFNAVPQLNEKIDLEPIGNHCRGTRFIDANHLINKNLVEAFHLISKQIPGFYYGRFDLKVPSLHDLENGNNIKILELNGMDSAPAHIYDSESTLFNAYKTLAKHIKIIYKIAKVQLQLGVKATPIFELLKKVRRL